MKIFRIAIAVLFMAALAAAAQDAAEPFAERVAELEERLEASEGEEHFEILVDLAELCRLEAEGDGMVEFGERALELLEYYPDPGRELTLTKALLSGYGYLENYDTALKFGRRAAALAADVGSDSDRAWVAMRIAECYDERGEYARALDLFAEARRLYEMLDEPEYLARTLNNAAVVHDSLARYVEAEELYLLARDAYERAGLRSGVALTIGNLASTWEELGHDEKALEGYQEALALSIAAEDDWVEADMLVYLGDFHVHREDPQAAFPYLQKAHALFQVQNRHSDLIGTHRSLGQAFELLDDDARALEHYERALALAKDLGIPIERAEAWLEIAGLRSRRGEASRAVALVESAVAILREQDAVDRLTPALDELAAAYAAAGRYRDAHGALREHAALQSEIWNAETQRTMAEMQSRFESQEKEKEIALLKKGQALKAVELERQKELRIALAGGFAGLLMILALLFNRYRLQNRAAMMRQSIAKEHEVNAQLREIDRMKDEFLANTSHELRTPLYGIIGLAETLRDRPDLDLEAPERGQLGAIVGSARRLERLVGDVLDFAKIRRSELELDRRPLDLRTSAEAVLALVRPFAEGKNLTLRNDVPADLPLADADPERLEQILLNLLGNAVKFTPEGLVEVVAERTGERLLVKVRDSGIGIGPEDRERIFDAFEQADGSMERVYGGAGLGLAVSRRLVELHSGEITVESTPGEGSTFAFTLPVASGEILPLSRPAPLGESAVSGDAVANAPPSAAQDRRRILIVDDEPVNRMILRQQLRLAGHDVSEAVDGFQALDNLDGVDLVVLDVMMPRMSGYEVCQHLRQRFSPAELPVIFVTAKDREEDLMAGFMAGGNDFLTKPVAKDELLARIGVHLAVATEHRRLEAAADHRLVEP